MPPKALSPRNPAKESDGAHSLPVSSSDSLTNSVPNMPSTPTKGPSRKRKAPTPPLSAVGPPFRHPPVVPSNASTNIHHTFTNNLSTISSIKDEEPTAVSPIPPPFFSAHPSQLAITTVPPTQPPQQSSIQKRPAKRALTAASSSAASKRSSIPAPHGPPPPPPSKTRSSATRGRGTAAKRKTNCSKKNLVASSRKGTNGENTTATSNLDSTSNVAKSVPNSLPSGASPSSPSTGVANSAIDEIINESNDLLQAASEAQSLGRLRMATSYLLLAHARLVGLGRRFDRSRYVVDEQEGKVEDGCYEYVWVGGRDEENLSQNNIKNDKSPDRNGPAHASESAKNSCESRNPERPTSNPSSASPASPQQGNLPQNKKLNPLKLVAQCLPPNLELDVAMMEHLARAAMELHHKRTGRGMQHDAQMEKQAVQMRIKQAAKAANVTAEGHAPESAGAVLPTSSNITGNTPASVAWTQEEQILCRKLASQFRSRIGKDATSNSAKETAKSKGKKGGNSKADTTCKSTSKNTRQSSNNSCAFPPVPEFSEKELHELAVLITAKMGNRRSLAQVRAHLKHDQLMHAGLNAMGSIGALGPNQIDSDAKPLPVTTKTLTGSASTEVLPPKASFSANLSSSSEVASSMVAPSKTKGTGDTPIKRKGGRGKKPPPLVMHTVPCANLDARKLMQGLLCNTQQIE